MADVARQRRANRPTSAVEKTRSVREGHASLLRPASAGVWRSKPSVYVASAAKEQGLLGDTSEESATSRSSMSESSQHSAVQGLRDRVSKAGPTSRTSSTTSMVSSRNGSRASGGDSKKGNADVWMMAPSMPSSGRHGWEEGQPPRGKGSDRGSNYVEHSERMRKLSRLPSEKDRNRLLQLEESFQSAMANGGRSAKPCLDLLERLGRLYNSIAMQYLQQGEHSHALDLLQSAESLISEGAQGNASFDSLKGLTYNNLGCYFRREGMPMEALKWLRQAHDIEQRVGEDSSRSSTFLNLCAVYSLLGKHLEALQCATQALKHLKAVLQRNPDASLSASVPGMEKVDTASMLAIAYHNIAVEQEYLFRFDEAVDSYRKALQVAETQCGSKSQLAAKIRLALTAAANAAQAAASTTLDTETSVASLESRNVGDEYGSLRARGWAGREHEMRPSDKQRQRDRERTIEREREHSKKEQDMTIESLSMESMSESGSGSGVRKTDAREPHRSHDKRTTLGKLPLTGGERDPSGTAPERTKSSGKSGLARLPSAGTSVGAKGQVRAHKPQQGQDKESSWGSDKSPGSASSRDCSKERSKERSKRPLSAARLPTNDTSTSLEGPEAPRAAPAKRHSRKTARPRTAGRDRLPVQDREELLAMTDPSSSDAGEYEALPDDAIFSDNESQAPSRAGNKPWENGEEGGEGASVFGGKSQEGSAAMRHTGRPMSASRPALQSGAVGTWRQTRTSRKTARPRTAGRERMHENDREDLLVLSSADDDGGAYEYLSEGDDESARRSPLGVRCSERMSVDEYTRSGGQGNVRPADPRHTDSAGACRMEADGGGGKGRSKRPLSAGVSFKSPSNASNLPHTMRPQSAPAWRPDGRLARAPPAASGNQATQHALEEDEDEDEDEDEHIIDSDEEEQLQRVAILAGVQTGAASALRPVDSGQRRLLRPASSNPPPHAATANGSSKANNKSSSAVPQLLGETDDDDEGDEEELDTKGILMHQTEVLTAELQKSKERERELHDRISRLQETRGSNGQETPASKDLSNPRLHMPAPPPPADKPPLPPSNGKLVRKAAFGLPEVGLDALDDQAAPLALDKPGQSGARALPPRSNQSASRPPARSTAYVLAGGGGMGAARREAVDDDAEIRELTNSLRIAAHQKRSNSMPSSPAHSTSSSLAGSSVGGRQVRAGGGMQDMLAKPPSPMATLAHNSVKMDGWWRADASTRGVAAASTRGVGGAHSSDDVSSAGMAWSQVPATPSLSSPGSASVPNSTRGEMSDSSRASSLSRPAALRPLPASRRRRQNAEASRAAQLERHAAQALQDAWRAHVARARVQRRRALGRRRASKAKAASQERPHQKPSRSASLGHHDIAKREARSQSRPSGGERASGRTRQQSGGAQTRLVQDEKTKRRAALTLQRVLRGWQARRQVFATLDWSVVREAARHPRHPASSCAPSWSAATHMGGRKDKMDREEAGAGMAWCYDSSAYHASREGDESRIPSPGPRGTPLHSTGVGEESLEGLLQDLGL